MKLLVDIGNTRLKSALLVEGRLIEHRALNWREHDLASCLADLWSDLPQPTAVAISSVAAKEMVECVRAHARDSWRLQPQIARVRAETFGLRCGYEQPESLGVDRWLAMLGAWGRSQTPWLVADLGTAATLDVIDSTGQHLGGCIYAGVETQRRALSRQTAALPEVDKETSDLLARETHGGIALGTLLSVVGGVRELYSNVTAWRHCEGISLCLTGGASSTVAERLNHGHMVFPHLVLEGLAMSEFAEKIIPTESVANST